MPSRTPSWTALVCLLAFAGCSAGLIGMLSAANQSGGEKTATAVWIGSVVAGALAGGGAGIALARKLHGQ